MCCLSDWRRMIFRQFYTSREFTLRNLFQVVSSVLWSLRRGVGVASSPPKKKLFENDTVLFVSVLTLALQPSQI